MSQETEAPASPGPEEPQVQIELGPHADIYESVLPPEAPAPPEAEALDSVEAPLPPETTPDAGPERGSRRQVGEEAYQRGLLEGRQRYENEVRNEQARLAFEQQQAQATQRVEQLFQAAESPNLNIRQQAWQQILDMYRGNRQAQALTSATRQQILQEMAADFGTLKDIDGIGEAEYPQLHNAPSAADLARRAFDLGKKSQADHVARLEAELAGLRGRLVGSRATPEASNGGASDISAPISIEEYIAMSPKEAKKLSPAQIDALTQQLAAAAGRNGRSF